jgi:hypothetical protein
VIDKYLKFETISIVIVGEFNPAIFQPMWFANKKLIREIEAINVLNLLVHNEMVRFDLDWLNIEVTRNRCVFVTSKDGHFEPLKDLVTDIFKILNETPIQSFGINHTFELTLETESKYVMFGSKLTPLNYWEDYCNEPRLLQLEILEKERKDIKGASRRIRILPSDSKYKIPFGVSINVNNHFELSNNKIGFLIEDNWDNTKNESKKIVNNLLKKINN